MPERLLTQSLAHHDCAVFRGKKATIMLRLDHLSPAITTGERASAGFRFHAVKALRPSEPGSGTRLLVARTRL